MGLTWTQLPEEIKYTAKQFGFYLIGIPSVVAVVYMFASWTPLPSDAIVGTSSFSIAVLISLFLGGSVAKEKLLGIHEVLLSLPFDPVKFISMRALASFIIGIAGIAVGSVAGWFIALHVGTPISLTTVSIGILISVPALFSFTFLIILITLLFQSKYLDVAKLIIFFTAYFGPACIPKYFGVGFSLEIALVLSLLMSMGALAVSYLIIHPLGERLAEKMVLV
ncbi:hypothetical protein TEU_11495 [Thermococcus eurythermalis]|uniref:Uncharacterized protein n=1 Tax=Thermococcus eurythermalis TaxID=1505907 RepID=A0A097QWR0_9EURY|nr:hypothetical protein [Thermococcus eurythermalis]AIU70898.1 hypothetical protein TEU_11495 [Thermococcus eurythermalis]